MIAVDSNLLVYAHREDSEFHEPALATLVSAHRGGAVPGYPENCLETFE